MEDLGFFNLLNGLLNTDLSELILFSVELVRSNEKVPF